jgi:hypothetical protein
MKKTIVATLVTVAIFCVGIFSLYLYQKSRPTSIYKAEDNSGNAFQKETEIIGTTTNADAPKETQRQLGSTETIDKPTHPAQTPSPATKGEGLGSVVIPPPPSIMPDSACEKTNCHGFDVVCGNATGLMCTMEYRLGDFCRQFAYCKRETNGSCVTAFTDDFTTCVSCVKKCMDIQDSEKAFACEETCRKQFTN